MQLQLACQHLGAAQLTLRAPLEYLAFVLPASHQRRPLLLCAHSCTSSVHRSVHADLSKAVSRFKKNVLTCDFGFGSLNP